MVIVSSTVLRGAQEFMLYLQLFPQVFLQRAFARSATLVQPSAPYVSDLNCVFRQLHPLNYFFLRYNVSV